EASEAARAIGAANTLSFRDGRIVADNTDAGGLLRSLPPSLAAASGGTEPAGRGQPRALVLGAGGAARGAIWALASGGVGAPTETGGGATRGADDQPGAPLVVPPFAVDVWNRSAERAATVARQLGATVVPDPSAADYDLIVNTTAVGLGGEDPFEHLPLAANSFRPGQVVVDMVYGEEP